MYQSKDVANVKVFANKQTGQTDGQLIAPNLSMRGIKILTEVCNAVYFRSCIDQLQARDLMAPITRGMPNGPVLDNRIPFAQ